jgi:hypothetical protein
MNAEPAARRYACLECGAWQEVPPGHVGAVWCPCGSPEPMLAGPAVPDVAAQLVSGTLEALGHFAVPPLPVADIAGITALYEQAMAELGRSMGFYLDAAAAMLDEANGYFLGLVPGFPGPLPWDRPDADVLGDIRAAMAVTDPLRFPRLDIPGPPVTGGILPAMEAAPVVTIRSTDSPARISPEVRTRADQDRSVQFGDRTWTPGHP